MKKLKKKTHFFRLFECALFYGIDPFYATGLFLYPLKISENLWFSVFRGIESDQWQEVG